VAPARTLVRVLENRFCAWQTNTDHAHHHRGKSWQRIAPLPAKSGDQHYAFSRSPAGAITPAKTIRRLRHGKLFEGRELWRCVYSREDKYFSPAREDSACCFRGDQRRKASAG